MDCKHSHKQYRFQRRDGSCVLCTAPAVVPQVTTPIADVAVLGLAIADVIAGRGGQIAVAKLQSAWTDFREAHPHIYAAMIRTRTR